MGGSSGSGGGSFGGGKGRAGADPCNIRSTTTLQSVKIAALTTVSVGDVMHIEPYPNVDSQTVGCINPDNNKLLGTISIAAQATLLKCLENGAIYRGTVMLLEGARCDVQIKRIS